MSNRAPILIDVSRLIWRRWMNTRPTGIDRVCLAYLEHYAPRSQAVIQARGFRRILCEKTSSLLFSLLLEEAPNFRRRFSTQVARHFLSIGPALSGNQRLYLNVGHTGLDKPQFRHWVKSMDVRPIYFIHDLIPITHPEYCRAGETQRHTKRIRTALGTGAAIIANSQTTLNQLSAFALQHSIQGPPQIAAWLGGARLVSTALNASEADSNYFVSLGTIEGRKNHLLLLNIWSQLVREGGPSIPRLKIIGQRGWEADQVFAMLDRNQDLREHVVEINNCTDRELAVQLAHARALLFSSMAEGFGLPLIEALGQGVPVIASNIPIFYEIAGDIPEYIDPVDGLGWKKMIKEYCNPLSVSRSEQLERMIGYKMPDWQDHFSKLDSWLNNMCPANKLND